MNRNLLLALLVAIGIANFADRQIIYILLEPIKHDLRLSDTELSLLSSTLFAIFYSIIGLPVARLAERWDRGRIIALSLLLWSVMTIVSGLAGSFAALVVARIGVGVGQAGVGPASHALIAEHFEPERRATALALLTLGGTIGIFVALAVGGWLGQAYGWHKAMMLIGLPGLVLMPFVLWWLKDGRPSPAFSLNLFTAPPGGTSFGAALALFWRTKVWRYAAIATMFTHLTTFSIGGWMPSLLQRSFHLGAREAGLLLAVAIGICGAVGSIVGGIFADSMVKRRGPAWAAWSMTVTFLAASVLAPMVLLSAAKFSFVALLCPYFAFMLTSAGVQFAIGQSALPRELWATSSAVLILIINLIGLGVGPTVAGLLSDALAPSFGANSLRYALLIMSPLSLGTATFYFLAGREMQPSDAR